MQWLNDAEQRMWRSYLEATRLLLRALDRQLSDAAGLTLGDYEVLALLSEAPQRRLRMSELAEVTVTTRGGATRVVNRLAEAGWVRRLACEEDKRGFFAELTDAGAAKLDSASPGHVAAVRSYLFHQLSPRDIERFSHAYRQVRDNLLESP